MGITIRNWPREAEFTTYQTSSSKEQADAEKAAEALSRSDPKASGTTFDAFLPQASEDSGTGFKVRSSAPDDSVGQLAALLAKAETRIDVLQVSSKATRALVNLKMSAMACDEKDAKKIEQMIKRMEKLIKRIKRKLQHLNKEEQLENRKKQAEKKKDMQKADEIDKDLTTRRRKRRRDERDYARKELAEDGKNAAEEMASSMTGSGAASFSDPSMGMDMGSLDMGMSVPSMEGGSIDVMV